jgi:hypothetical protein
MPKQRSNDGRRRTNIASYALLSDFKLNPSTGIDTTQLVPGGTPTEQDTALQTMLDVATAWINEKLDVDTLTATVGLVETRDAHVNRMGDVIVFLRNRPATNVSLVRYRTPGTSTWTTVSSTNYDVLDKNRVAIRGLNMFNFAFVGQPFQLQSPMYGYRSPLDNSAMMRIPLLVEVTYDYGFATIPILAKQACIIYAAHIIHQRGSTSITLEGNASTIGGSPFGDKDLDTALDMIKSLKRVI